MILDPFSGPGSTPLRRAFWNDARKSVLSLRKIAGRHVTVDEHPGKGTVINVADTSARRPPRGPSPAAATGACCDPCGFCTETTEAGCTGDSIWLGLGTVCSPNPCETPRFTVAIRFQFTSTNAPMDGAADFTKTSDPTTATLVAGGQSQNWNNSQSMSYHCTTGGLLESVTFDQIGYTLNCSGAFWVPAIDWVATSLVCSRNFTFQPTDILSSDPTGVHVYNLSAFGGEWLFTITVTITNYP